MEHHDHLPTAVPRGPLIGAGVLVTLAIVAAAAVRLTGLGASHEPDAAAVTVRELRFEDRADGSIAVLDAAGRPVTTVASGTGGFLRGTLRGLARERRREGIDAGPPFRLVGRADGRLTLEDPATGRRVDLESFGPTNAAVFADLIATRSTAR